MANVIIKDGGAATKYLKATGAGSDGDPWIPEHKETSAVAILAAVDGVEALLTTVDADTSTLAGAVAGTEMQVDVVTSALPTGAATAALQTTLNGYVDGIEALLTTIDADTSTLAAAVSTEMQVDVVGALPAGDNNIGNVDIASALPAGTNNIGDVDVLSIAAGTNTIGATRDAGPSWTSAFGVTSARVTSADATGIVAVTDAPTSGQKIVLTDIIISVGATAMLVDVQEETSATKLISVYMAANSTVQLTPRGKLKLATADKKVTIDTSAAGNVAVTAFYYSEA